METLKVRFVLKYFSCKKILKNNGLIFFLKVQTAIQSCVRSGIVCALYDGKYRLIGPNPRAMVSHCTSRLTHGPRCCCLTLIKCMSKSMATSCCAFQWDFSPLKTKCNKQIQTVAVKESKDLDKTEEGKSWCKENTKKRKCDQDEKKNNSDNECRNSKKSKKDSSCQSDKKKSNEEDKKSKKLKRDASCQPDKDRPGSSYNRRIQNLKKRLMNRRSFSPARVECIPEGEERKICTSCGKLDVIYYPTTSNFASNDD